MSSLRKAACLAPLLLLLQVRAYAAAPASAPRGEAV